MSLLYCAGELGNLFARGTTTCDPAALATAPLNKAYDGKSDPYISGSIAADGYVQVRNNLLANPGFETALGAEWVQASVAPGTAALGGAGTGRVGGATNCLRCNGGGGAGIGQRYQPKVVRAGERMRLDGWCKPGAGKTGSFRVYCVETAQWCVAGVWQAAPGDLVAVTNDAAYQRCALTLFATPTLADALWPTLTLWVYCRTAENANVDFDDVALIPAVNGASVHGHNHHTCITPTLRYSDDAFAADDTLAATFTIRRPTYYAYLTTAIYREYWRFKLGGTPSAAPSQSELWAGYFEQAQVAQEDGWSVNHLPVTNLVGAPTSHMRSRQGSDRPRRLELSHEYWMEAEWQELVRDIDARTYGGHGPIVIVPSTLSNEAPVIYGHINPGELQLLREGPVTWRAKLSITEMGFPSLGA